MIIRISSQSGVHPLGHDGHPLLRTGQFSLLKISNFQFLFIFVILDDKSLRKLIIQDLGPFGILHQYILLEIQQEYRPAFCSANINLFTENGRDSLHDLNSFSFQEFNGRVYATGNPQACFELGTGQTEISLRIPIGTQCGSVQSVSSLSLSESLDGISMCRDGADMSTTWSFRPIRSSCRCGFHINIRFQFYFLARFWLGLVVFRLISWELQVKLLLRLVTESLSHSLSQSLASYLNIHIRNQRFSDLVRT